MLIFFHSLRASGISPVIPKSWVRHSPSNTTRYGRGTKLSRVIVNSQALKRMRSAPIKPRGNIKLEKLASLALEFVFHAGTLMEKLMSRTTPSSEL